MLGGGDVSADACLATGGDRFTDALGLACVARCNVSLQIPLRRTAEHSDLDRSHRLRIKDIRRVFRLVFSLQSRLPDADAWRHHTVMGLSQMLHARFAMASEWMNYWPDQPVKPLRPIVSHELEEILPPPVLSRFRHRFLVENRWQEDPMVRATLGCRTWLSTLMRSQLYDNAEWYRDGFVNEILKPANLNHPMVSLHRIGSSGRVSTIFLYRGWNDTPFTVRHRRMLHLFHAELLHTLANNHAGNRVKQVKDLPKRQRQVLLAVMRGLRAKQIAFEMGIKESTVREHLTVLYRRFGVADIGELLSLFLGVRSERIIAAEPVSLATPDGQVPDDETG